MHTCNYAGREAILAACAVLDGGPMGDHDTCSEVGAPFWSSISDDEAGRPFWCSEEGEEAEHAAHALVEAEHVRHAAHSLGGHSHGPPPDPIVTTRPAEGADLEEVMDAILDEREASRVGVVETGDPLYVPGPGERARYPVADGALDGRIVRDRARVGEDWTRRSVPRRRIEDDTGDFFAEGDPSMESRALAPRYDGSGDPLPDYIGTDTEFRVAEEFPVERSVARDWFAQPGGAAQVRTPMSTADLVESGHLEFERSMSIDYANFEETAEIMSAVAEEEEAARLAADAAARMPTRTPHPDIATMLDDMSLAEEMRLAEAGDVAAIATRAAPAVTAPARDLSAIGTFDSVELASASHSLGAVEALGAAGSAWQFGTGIGEVLNGEYDQGSLDTAAGGLGLGTTLASSGMLGEGAVAGALACPPAAVGAAALGLIAAGHERNAEEDLWGDATVDEDGNVHHLTSLDFAMANGSDAYHGIHDAVADGIGGDVGDGVGMLLGGLGGGLVGLGAGVVGLGGDLVAGVEVTGEALGHLATAGDRYMGERGVWGEPTVDEEGHEHPRSSVDMVVDDTVATYDDWHDSAMDAGLGETASSAVGGLAGGAMAIGDSVIALGGNLVGLAGAGIETASSAASAAWSWLTD